MKPVPQPPRSHGAMVALIEDGIPRFSEKPRQHKTKFAAHKEAERLAEKYPGKLFQVFGPAAVVSSTGFGPKAAVIPLVAYKAPPPPVPVYTAKQLLKSAPDGVYKKANSGDLARFLVATYDENRVVMFVSGYSHAASPMSGDAWGDTRFVRTDETIRLKRSNAL